MNIKTMAFCLIAAVLACPDFSDARDTEVRLSISKKINTKVKVLMPPFTEAHARPDQVSGLRSKILKDMESSGVIVPMHQGELLREAEENDRRQDRVLFANWARFGADALLKVEDNSRVGECDFTATAYALQTQQRLFSKRYKGKAATQKKLVHAMTNDLVMALTGNEGIALSKIAFINDSTGHKELYVMDYDGDNMRRISTDRSLMLYPRWSPDGKDLVAVSYLRSKPNICRIDVARGTRQFISTFPGLNAGASFSPDGKSLALTLSKDGNPEIYVLNLSSGRAQRLTKDRAVDSSPTWSPDGKRIAFASVRDGNEDIYAADISGGNLKRLTDAPADDCYPCWSPDGKTIAFASDRTGAREIHVMTSDGGDPRLLIPNSSHPAWSPDGKRLAYVGWGAENPNQGPRPYMADADGSHAKRLADISLTSSNLSWSPDGKHVVCVGGNAGFQVIDVESGEYRVIGRGSKTAKYPHWRPK